MTLSAVRRQLAHLLSQIDRPEALSPCVKTALALLACQGGQTALIAEGHEAANETSEFELARLLDEVLAELERKDRSAVGPFTRVA